RGGYPNVWSIIDRTPAGATLHYIDEGVDTGPVIAQRRVEVGPTDTGATLYRRLERACVDVFRDTWPDLARGSIRAAPQDPSAGTSHRDRDVKEIDRIDLDATYRARDLIDLLRARTFPPHRGAYFVEGGRRIYLRLELEAEPAATPDRARPAAPRRRAVPTTVAE
ncbi:MAG: formyltransferase family protein, partial [Planctomycetota bacterium]